jgi:putative resolvase
VLTNVFVRGKIYSWTIHILRKHLVSSLGVPPIPCEIWDREGTRHAPIGPPTNRRYYTHDQYLEYMGLVANKKGQTIVYARVSRSSQKPDLAKKTGSTTIPTRNDHEIEVDSFLQDIASRT